MNKKNIPKSSNELQTNHSPNLAEIVNIENKEKNIERHYTNQNEVVDAPYQDASKDGVIQFVTPEAEGLVAEERTYVPTTDVLTTNVPASGEPATDDSLTQDFEAESFDQIMGDYIE